MTMTLQPALPLRTPLGDPEGELEAAIASKNYLRAAMLGERFRRPWEEIRRLQELALGQMACDYRNAVATAVGILESGDEDCPRRSFGGA